MRLSAVIACSQQGATAWWATLLLAPSLTTTLEHLSVIRLLARPHSASTDKAGLQSPHKILARQAF